MSDALTSDDPRYGQMFDVKGASGGPASASMKKPGTSAGPRPAAKPRPAAYDDLEGAEPLPTIEVPLSAIRELDEPYWSHDGTPLTCRDIAEHAQLIDEADLGYPIILSSDGRVMDGMHRAVKALMRNLTHLPAKQFAQDPEPDHVGVDPDDLPY